MILFEDELYSANELRFHLNLLTVNQPKIHLKSSLRPEFLI